MAHYLSTLSSFIRNIAVDIFEEVEEVCGLIPVNERQMGRKTKRCDTV